MIILSFCMTYVFWCKGTTKMREYKIKRGKPDSTIPLSAKKKGSHKCCLSLRRERDSFSASSKAQAITNPGASHPLSLKRKKGSHKCCLSLRRERDSNPRYLSVRRFSRPMQSTTLPSLQSKGDLLSPCPLYALRGSNPGPID